MKDQTSRRLAEQAVLDAKDAVAKATAARNEIAMLAKKFDNWIPQFEKAATATMAEQMRNHVAPLAIQLREISANLAKLEVKVGSTLKQNDVEDLKKRVLKTEQTLKRFSAALAS